MSPLESVEKPDNHLLCTTPILSSAEKEENPPASTVSGDNEDRNELLKRISQLETALNKSQRENTELKAQSEKFEKLYAKL